MCVEGGIFFFKINKRDSTFIREMRVVSKDTENQCIDICYWIFFVKSRRKKEAIS